jgi:hypothetical protein
MEKKMDLTCSEPKAMHEQAIRELNDISTMSAAEASCGALS